MGKILTIMNKLLTAVSHLYQQHIPQYPVLSKIVADIGQIQTEQAIPALRLPVVDEWLETAVSLAQGHAGQAIVNAMWEMTDRFHWVTAYANYAGEPDIDLLRQNMAYTEVAGPINLYQAHINYPCSNIFFGFLLQAPHTYYPPHVHKAEEFYFVLSGTAVWQRGREWQVRPPGSFIHHGSGVVHAMQTHHEPLLALAAWISDLNSELVIVRDIN